jgi:hypothetical protein
MTFVGRVVVFWVAARRRFVGSLSLYYSGSFVLPLARMRKHLATSTLSIEALEEVGGARGELGLGWGDSGTESGQPCKP